jgi:hypothetical protein
MLHCEHSQFNQRKAANSTLIPRDKESVGYSQKKHLEGEHGLQRVPLVLSMHQTQVALVPICQDVAPGGRGGGTCGA